MQVLKQERGRAIQAKDAELIHVPQQGQRRTQGAALKLLLIWPLVLAASAGVSFAIARRAHALGIRPWRRNVP